MGSMVREWVVGGQLMEFDWLRNDDVMDEGGES